MKTTRIFFVSAMTLILIVLVAGNVSAQSTLKNGGTIRNTGTATYKEIQNYSATANGTILNSGTLNTTTSGSGTGKFRNTNGSTRTGTVHNYIGGVGTGFATIVVVDSIFNNNAGATILNDTIAGLSTIKVAGGISNTGGTFTTTKGRVIYNGSGAQNVLATTYGVLVTDVGGTKTLADTTIVNDSLRIDNSSTLAVSTYKLNLAGATNVAQNSGALTANAGIVVYNGDRNQSMIVAQYKTLTLTGSGSAHTKTLPDSLYFAASGSLTVNANDTLFVSSGRLNLSTNSPSLTNTGAIKVAGNALFNTNITAAGTFYYFGGSAQSIGGVTYTDLILGGAGTKTFNSGDTIAVTGNYTIQGGAGGRTYAGSYFRFAGSTGTQTLNGQGETFNVLQFKGAALKSLTGTTGAFGAAKIDLLTGTGVVTNNVVGTIALTNVSGVSLTISSGTELVNSASSTITLTGDLNNDGTLTNAGTITAL